MRIGLKSGLVFTCEDESYTSTNKISGERIHTFISFNDQKKYVVRDEDIEFLESELIEEDIEELNMYGGCDEEEDCIDNSFG